VGDGRIELNAVSRMQDKVWFDGAAALDALSGAVKAAPGRVNNRRATSTVLSFDCLDQRRRDAVNGL
jgi:hypothetical protein